MEEPHFIRESLGANHAYQVFLLGGTPFPQITGFAKNESKVFESLALEGRPARRVYLKNLLKRSDRLLPNAASISAELAGHSTVHFEADVPRGKLIPRTWLRAGKFVEDMAVRQTL